jgi:cardiolipin synthase
MRTKHFVGSLVILLFAAFFIFYKNGAGHSIPPVTTSKTMQSNSTLSIITEPDQGIAPVLTLIENASTSVDLVMYELEDKQIDAALVADEKRGVAVRVLISLGYQGADFAANQPAYNFLRANGVPTEWTQSYFALTHEKSLVVDNNTAIIMTFNFTPQYYSTSRDFGIVDKDENDIAAMDAAFESDWRGDHASAQNGDDLVWSPGSEPAIVSLINNAQKSLHIYNEEMADPRIIKALIDAAQRGVAVRVDMTYSSQWKKAFQELTTAGATVRTYDEKAPLYIHAKMVLADSAQAFVGSENFSANSLNDNRELGIVINNSSTIASLENTFNSDWKNATLFNL